MFIFIETELRTIEIQKCDNNGARMSERVWIQHEILKVCLEAQQSSKCSTGGGFN